MLPFRVYCVWEKHTHLKIRHSAQKNRSKILLSCVLEAGKISHSGFLLQPFLAWGSCPRETRGSRWEYETGWKELSHELREPWTYGVHRLLVFRVRVSGPFLHFEQSLRIWNSSNETLTFIFFTKKNYFVWKFLWVIGSSFFLHLVGNYSVEFLS